jgi:hypothetical protein
MNFLLGVLLTLVFEGAVFLPVKFEDRDFWIIFALANTVSNLFVNLTVSLCYGIVPRTWLILILYVLEVSAVLFEYWIYSKKEGRSMRLFIYTFLANLFSYVLGLLLFGHI